MSSQPVFREHAAVLPDDDRHIPAVLGDERLILIDIHFPHAIAAADELCFHVIAEPATAAGVQNQLVHVRARTLGPLDLWTLGPVSYTHLTLPTSDLV